MKEEKDIAPMDFAEYLRKSGVSGNTKIYWHERCCYISQSKSLLVTGFWSRHGGGTFKWMHCQNVLSSWDLQQITDMLYVREIAEKFLSTLLLMFISSYYFI